MFDRTLRLIPLFVPLVAVGCHRPWLQSESAPTNPASQPDYGGSYGSEGATYGPPADSYAPPAYSPGPASQPAPYQPAVHRPAPATASGAPASATLGRQAAEAARQLEGSPYCWGGTGPSCYDCSGLASAAWARVGVVLPRTSDAMREKMQRIHWSQVQPGDVLWRPGHVGLYVERGWAIHAPGEGKAVQYQPAQTYEVALRPY